MDVYIYILCNGLFCVYVKDWLIIREIKFLKYCIYWGYDGGDCINIFFFMGGGSL